MLCKEDSDVLTSWYGRSTQMFTAAFRLEVKSRVSRCGKQPGMYLLAGRYARAYTSTSLATLAPH